MRIEETMRIASSFQNAEIKIVPPHPEIIFRVVYATWYMRLNVMDADPSMLGKQAGVLPQG